MRGAAAAGRDEQLLDRRRHRGGSSRPGSSARCSRTGIGAVVPIRITCVPPRAEAPGRAHRFERLEAHFGEAAAGRKQDRSSERRPGEHRCGQRRRPVALVDHDDRLGPGARESGPGRRPGRPMPRRQWSRRRRRGSCCAVVTLTAPSASTGAQVLQRPAATRNRPACWSCRNRRSSWRLPRELVAGRARGTAAEHRRHTIGRSGKLAICGEKQSYVELGPQVSDQFGSLPSRMPNPWLDVRERGTQFVGANPTKSVRSAGSFSASPSANPAGRRKRSLFCSYVSRAR